MPSFNRIAGIDISLTNTGLAGIEAVPNGWECNWRTSTGKEIANLADPIRQFEILDVVRDFCRLFGPEVIVIEDYAMGRAVGKAFTRAELGGMIKNWLLAEVGVPVYLVAPSALKRFMGCSDKKSRGDKDAMFVAAAQKFKFISTNNDIVDAYCLTRYLAANLTGQTLPLVRLDPLPQYRQSAVQAPAPKKVVTDTKNRLLTTPTRRFTVKPLPRRIRF